jgi:ferritin
MLHSKYRSSTKAKKLSRKVKQSMLDDEVDQIMNRSSYRDITHRVKELTKDARKDSDFQNAFNRANLELLTTFKTEQIREEDDDDDDDDDVTTSNNNDDGDNGDDDSPQVVSSAL